MQVAPTAIGGLDLQLLEIESGVQAIQRLVSLFLSDSTSNFLLSTAIEYHQLEVGTESLFFDTPFPILSPLATSTWVTHLW